MEFLSDDQVATYGRFVGEPSRRTATLLAAVRELEADAVDDALDLVDLLMATRLVSAARRATAAEAGGDAEAGTRLDHPGRRGPRTAAVSWPGTLRDSLFILDAILTIDAGPKPEMVATDTASYSDIVFGPFRMPGYRFSPRIADLSDQRFRRADPG